MSNELPSEVVTCLKNARYLHLATSDGLWPHVSLMNYTYLPTPSPDHPIPSPSSSSPPTTASSTSPIIILTLQPTARSTHNLLSNPRVSLLVHDWVSHRRSVPGLSSSSSSPPTSSLQEMLTNLNTAALSSISATLFGYATVLQQESAEEKWYKKVHEENNPSGATEGRCYLEGEDVRVVVVRVAWARVADYRGFVRDWVGEGGEGFETGPGGVGAAGTGAVVPEGVNGA